MGCLGNCIWFLCGGFWEGLLWVLVGLVLCLTLVGIPLGVQCFKFASLAFFPFGKTVKYGGSGVSVIANVIWLLFGGLPLAACACLNGLLLCLTIIGIPFGKQCFKIARLALTPFGATVISG